MLQQFYNLFGTRNQPTPSNDITDHKTNHTSPLSQQKTSVLESIEIDTKPEPTDPSFLVVTTHSSSKMISPVLPVKNEKESRPASSADLITIDLDTKEEPQQPTLPTIKEARKFLRDLNNQTSPWSFDDWRTWFSAILAIFSATCTTTSSGSLAKKCFAGDEIKALLSENIREPLTFGTTIAATVTVFLFSGRANVTVLNQLTRSLPDTSLQDIKRNIVPLAFTALSSLGSFKVNWDALKDTFPQLLRIIFSVGRGFSALPTNALFSIQMLKNIKGVKKSPIMQLIQESRAKLASLPNDEFIHALQYSNLFKCLIQINPDAMNPTDSIHQLFTSLLRLKQDNNAAALILPASKSSKFRTATAWLLGCLSATPYLKSGQTVVPELFSMNGQIAIWSLGLLLGVSSAAVNMSIAAIAIANYLNNLSNKSCSVSDCFTLPLKLACQIGYAAANAGLAFQAPLINGWVEAAINFVVYFCIGDMALDTFASKLQNSYYAYLLRDAKMATISEDNSLEDYYETLSDKEKVMLVRLLGDYLKWAFDSITDFFNHTVDAQANNLLTPEQRKKLYSANTTDTANIAPDEKNIPPVSPIQMSSLAVPTIFSPPRSPTTSHALTPNLFQRERDESLISRTAPTS